MPNSESRKPEDSQAAATADAGEEKKQADEPMVSRDIAPPPDYDSREKNKSTQRKPMGPPLKEGEAALEDVQREFRDEKPVDPA